MRIDLFSLRSVWLLILPIGLLCRLNLGSIQPHDFWWHVRTGQITLAAGAIPTIDLFTFTRTGEIWINQAWLMQVWMALLMAAGGPALVLAVHALTIATGYSLILWGIAGRWGVRLSVMAAIFGVALGIQNWAVRPQTFSFLAFGLLVLLVETHRAGRIHRLWWVVPLFALWGNAHGAFIFGIVYLGIYVVGTLIDAIRNGTVRLQRAPLLILCAQGALALAALTFNPQGIVGLLDYVRGFLQSEATLEYNMEFAPLTLRMADGMIMAVAVVWLITVRLRSNRPFHTAQVLTLLVFATLALLSRRSIPWFGMILIPILAEQLQGWWQQPRPLSHGNRLINGIILAALMFGYGVTLPWVRPFIPALAERYPILSEKTPVAAAAQLCTTVAPGTRGFQALGYASYLTVACPALPLFRDPRFELYSLEDWEEYIALMRGRYDWEQILDKYHITYIFADVVEQRHLVDAATDSPRWEALYQDEQAVVLLRVAAGPP